MLQRPTPARLYIEKAATWFAPRPRLSRCNLCRRSSGREIRDPSGSFVFRFHLLLAVEDLGGVLANTNILHFKYELILHRVRVPGGWHYVLL